MNNKHLYSFNDTIAVPSASLALATPVMPSEPTPPTPPQFTNLSELMAMPGVKVQGNVPVLATPAIFTLSKASKQVFSIDGTTLAPSRLVLLSGAGFEAAYTKQLNATLFNDKEELDVAALMTLTSLSDIVEKSHRPIRLMSQALRKKLPTVCKVLNAFFQENQAVIRGISQQLSK
jgi:hypothetical protein